MPTYTVVLLYPDYLADDFGADVYVDTADAPDIYHAVRAVQKLAGAENDAVEDITDFRPILVLEGDCNVVASAIDF